MREIKRIYIIGAGAVGSVLAALIKEAGGAEAVLVGGSIHWRTIREKGLILDAAGRGEKTLELATMTPEEMPEPDPTDAVLLTGKLPSLPATAKWLTEKTGPEVPLVALQNGLEIQETVSTLMGRPVERGLCFFGANSREAGQVTYNRGLIRLKRSPVAEALVELLSRADIKPLLVDDFAPVEWFKLAINCVANPLAGLLAIDNESIRKEVLDPAKAAILEEVVKVARAAGEELELDVEFYNEKIRGSNVPSLKTDLDRSRRTEIDFINGAVVRKGEELGVPTPVNALIVSLVKFLETKGLAG